MAFIEFKRDNSMEGKDPLSRCVINTSRIVLV